jgi:IS30 family transposase
VGKGTDLNQFSGGDLRVIANRLNTMPRRVLGWSSAQGAYDHAVALIARTRPSSQKEHESWPSSPTF